jgi:peptide/nickel transport system ATP-binding protein
MTTSKHGLVVNAVRVDHIASGLPIISEVTFDVRPGQLLGLVGESGSGKTTAAMAVLGHARPGGRLVAGSSLIGDVDLVSLPPTELRRARGRLTSYVGQDPTSSLDPSMTIGRQLLEALLVHGFNRDDATARIAAYLTKVKLPSDQSMLDRYPHQLSGGQIQRVALALALAVDPDVVVLDEPTTGLDVKVQKSVLDTIAALKLESGAAFVYVSHDLAVVASIADHVAVMYGGYVVEHAPTATLFANPRHPYTARLLRAIPQITTERRQLEQIPGTAVGVLDRPPGCPFAPRCSAAVGACRERVPPVTMLGARHSLRCVNPETLRLAARVGTRAEDIDPSPTGAELLTVNGLNAWYPGGAGVFGVTAKPAASKPIVHDVSFNLGSSECFGVVGESGSGKTTLARCIGGLHPHWSGSVQLDGVELEPGVRARSMSVQREIQIVFQNPTASLNPRMTVFDALRHVLHRLRDVHGLSEQRKEASALLDLVRLPNRLLDSYPRELSGGEKQRVAIARALAPQPRLLLCDEITSALDVSVQAAIIDLIRELRRELDGLAVLFISHDLAVVRAVADTIAVMRNGVVVEQGSPEIILFSPRADYTRELLAAIPKMPFTMDAEERTLT